MANKAASGRRRRTGNRREPVTPGNDSRALRARLSMPLATSSRNGGEARSSNRSMRGGAKGKRSWTTKPANHGTSRYKSRNAIAERERDGRTSPQSASAKKRSADQARQDQ